MQPQHQSENFLKKLTIKLKQKCKGTRIAKSTLFSFKAGELETKTAFAMNIESAKATEWETNSVTYCSEQFDRKRVKTPSIYVT